MADIKTILDPLPIPRERKAEIWDAYQAANSPEDFQKRFDSLPIPKGTKAALWDAKFSQPKQPQSAGEAPPQSAASKFLGSLYDSTIGPAVHMVTHPIETAVNVAGSAARAVQDPVGSLKDLASRWQPIPEEIMQGDLPSAAGKAVGTALSVAAPEMAKGKGVPVSPKLAGTNPKVAAALDYLESKGVPVSAGARTDNYAVKAAQKWADTTPIGSKIASEAQGKAVEALRAEAGNIVKRATPPVSADTHYAAFREAEKMPQNIVDGVPLPTNVKEIKAAIRPIYAQISRWWEPARRNASAGYTAMKSILEGPDVVAASDAEAGLSGLKQLAREGDGRSAGVAKYIIPRLQEVIDNAAARGGSDVMYALQEGRKAAAAEVAVDKLTGILEKAQAEGGFNREAGIWHDWNRARPQILNQLPAAQVSDIDKFFLGAKRLAENPNPSGSALAGHVAAQGAAAIQMAVHPTAEGLVLGGSYVLGTGALSKLLHSPAGVRALRTGLKIPLNAPASTLAVSQLLKMAGSDVRPLAAAGNSPTANSDLMAGAGSR